MRFVALIPELGFTEWVFYCRNLVASFASVVWERIIRIKWWGDQICMRINLTVTFQGFSIKSRFKYIRHVTAMVPNRCNSVIELSIWQLFDAWWVWMPPWHFHYRIFFMTDSPALKLLQLKIRNYCWIKYLFKCRKILSYHFRFKHYLGKLGWNIKLCWNCDILHRSEINEVWLNLLHNFYIRCIWLLVILITMVRF